MYIHIICNFIKHNISVSKYFIHHGNPMPYSINCTPFKKNEVKEEENFIDPTMGKFT